MRGEHVDGDVYVPLATTEAALVASTNRGCAAIREAGGAVVRVEDVGMTRAPVFRTSGIEQTQDFLRWIQEHDGEIRGRRRAHQPLPRAARHPPLRLRHHASSSASASTPATPWA